MDKKLGHIIGHESESLDHIVQCKGMWDLCLCSLREKGVSLPTAEGCQLDVLTVCNSTELNS